MSRSVNFYNKEILPFKNQNYYELKRDCLRRKALFIDPLFPSQISSIYRTKDILNGIQPIWYRPHSLVKNPKFIVNNINSSDICQGSVGNCWFVASAAGLALYPEIFSKVCPLDQSFSTDYVGIFHFRFWIYGKWYDVVIDDQLPVNPYTGTLCFSRNIKEPNEFWGALLEKAYAKINGCYEYLDGGWGGDAITDFTGGVKENIDIPKWRMYNKVLEIFQILYYAKKYKSISVCAITANSGGQIEAVRPDGLVVGHQYTITDIAQITFNGQYINLVRLRNPWANEQEWKGPFSDGSYEWQYLDSKTKEKLRYRYDNDGEFWIPFDYLIAYFDKLEVVHLTPDLFGDEIKNKKSQINTWKMIQYDGQWIRGKTAGGLQANNYERPNFWDNPQFIITLDNVPSKDCKASVIIALMLKNRREKRLQLNFNGTTTTDLPISFLIYKVKDSRVARQAKERSIKLYANNLQECAQCDSPEYCKEIVKRYRLYPGDYVIIPFCHYANLDGEFLLRIFTECQLSQKSTCVLSRGKRSLKEEDTLFSRESFDDVENRGDNENDIIESITEFQI